MSPIIVHPDVRRMLMDHARQDAERARHLLPGGRGARPLASRDGCRRSERPQPSVPRCSRPSPRPFATDIGIEVASTRRPGPWRHGLHRGDRRGAASCAMPASPRSMRAPTASRPSTSSPQAAALRRRGGQGVDRRDARRRRRGRSAPIRRASAIPPPASALPSMRWSARPTGCWRRSASSQAERAGGRDALSHALRAGAGRHGAGEEGARHPLRGGRHGRPRHRPLLCRMRRDRSSGAGARRDGRCGAPSPDAAAVFAA